MPWRLTNWFIIVLFYHAKLILISFLSIFFIFLLPILHLFDWTSLAHSLFSISFSFLGTLLPWYYYAVDTINYWIPTYSNTQYSIVQKSSLQVIMNVSIISYSSMQGLLTYFCRTKQSLSSTDQLHDDDSSVASF